MITCTTLLKVRAGNESAFERLLLGLVHDVRANEPGTTLFQLVRSQTADRTYLVIEQYADKEALEFHSGTEYLKVFVPRLMPYLEEQPTLASYDPVE